MKHKKPLSQLLSEKMDQPLSPVQADELWADMAKRLEAEFPIGEQEQAEHLNDPAVPPGPTAAIGSTGWIGTLGFWVATGLIGLSIFSAVAFNARFNPAKPVVAPEQGNIYPPMVEQNGNNAIQAVSGGEISGNTLPQTMDTAMLEEYSSQTASKSTDPAHIAQLPLNASGSKASNNKQSTSKVKDNTLPGNARSAAGQASRPEDSRLVKTTAPQQGIAAQNGNAAAPRSNTDGAGIIAKSGAETTPSSPGDHRLSETDPPAATLRQQGLAAQDGPVSAGRAGAPLPTTNAGATAPTSAQETPDPSFWTDLQILTGNIDPVKPQQAFHFVPQKVPVTPIDPSRPHKTSQTKGFYLLAGSDLEKTHRMYQNYTPKASYINLGMAYRIPMGRKWSLQPEVNFLQLGTPRLVAVNQSIIDPEGARMLRNDTVSIMRQRGWGFNLLAVVELPYGFSVLGGYNIARYSKVMQERAYSERSLINNLGGSGRSWDYAYTDPPAWFQQYQGGLKFGVEKLFYRRAVVGVSLYKGLIDVSLSSNGSGVRNYPTNWVAYAGYRF